MIIYPWEYSDQIFVFHTLLSGNLSRPQPLCGNHSVLFYPLSLWPQLIGSMIGNWLWVSQNDSYLVSSQILFPENYTEKQTVHSWVGILKKRHVMMEPKSMHGERKLWISRGIGPIGNMKNPRVHTGENKQERGKNGEKEEREICLHPQCDMS